VSEGVRESFWLQGMMAGFPASYFCIKAFSETDLTEDLKKFDVPTLILHGDDDQIVPIADSAMLSSKLVKGAVLKVYKGAPHGMCTTLKDQVNEELLAFFKSSSKAVSADAERETVGSRAAAKGIHRKDRRGERREDPLHGRRQRPGGRAAARLRADQPDVAAGHAGAGGDAYRDCSGFARRGRLGTHAGRLRQEEHGHGHAGACTRARS
jgi:hypothetical protein